jgi:hypothetical protein
MTRKEQQQLLEECTAFLRALLPCQSGEGNVIWPRRDDEALPCAAERIAALLVTNGVSLLQTIQLY